MGMVHYMYACPSSKEVKTLTGSLQTKTLADGKEYYYMVLNFYDKHTGKRTPKWFSTGLCVKGNKRQAEQMLLDTLAQYPDRSYDATADTLFCDWVQMWLDAAKTYVRTSTWEGYSLTAKHIIDYFLKKKLTLSQLKPRHFKEYYTYMLKYGKKNQKTGELSGLAVRTVRSHKFIINAALNEAVEEEVLVRNPALNIKVSNAKKKSLAKKIVFFSLEESREFLKFVYAEDDVLADMIYATLQYGLRRSEALGLTEDSLDFKHHLLKIQNTVVKVTTLQEEADTKTPDSDRVYFMTPEMEKFFKGILLKKKKNKLFYGNTYVNSNKVFVWDDGHDIMPDYVYHHFKKLVKKFGRPDMTYHALRHSTASMLFEMGWHPKEIQEWLGHADFYTTMNIYTHIQKHHNQQNSERLTGVLMPHNYANGEQVLEQDQKSHDFHKKLAI